MKRQRIFLSITIYLFILFFSVIGFVYALNTTSNNQQIKVIGGKTVSKDGVTISKTISPTNKENFFDITLEVETNSNITNITTYPDLAVVIVMDISNTMMSTVADGSTRYESAIKASETFINKFKSETDKANALREIGFVAFNTNAHKIFDLQRCSSTACQDSKQNKSLINIMKDETSKIIKDIGYASSNTRYTNMEGGLKLAHDMLSKSSANNKYIIFVSDGMPTTYLKNSQTYQGYEPYSNGKVGSSEGVFGYTPKMWGCNYGTSYSDRGAIKARLEAHSIKKDNINIMVVGTGINSSSFKTIQDYLNHSGGNAKGFSVVDSEVDGSPNHEFEIGEASNKSSYVNWLTKKIASNNQYYNSDDSSITKVFNQIFTTIQSQLETSTEASWVANDPMGSLGQNNSIEFIGFYNDANPAQLQANLNQKNIASYNSSSSSINWDLKQSTYQTKHVENTTTGQITYYKYILKYKVRLKNENNDFKENTQYSTNGKTTLSYAVLNNGVLTEREPLEFKIPAVTGYLGEFSFTKYSSYSKEPLPNIKFRIVHNPNCSRHQGYENLTTKTVSIKDIEAISDKSGLVSFTNIPSGHEYILQEVDPPADYIKMEDKEVIVAYGVVYGKPANSEIINILKTGNLSITKKVAGNNTSSGPFEFEIDIKYNGQSLNNVPYKYEIKNGTGEVIKEGEETYRTKKVISLNNDETYIIKDLPVGATYSVKELTSSGYKVQHQINEGKKLLGDTAICNSNGCRIESGNKNKVLFINTTGYILPATGSSKMLILLIIGSLLLLVPLINILYMFCKRRKGDKHISP